MVKWEEKRLIEVADVFSGFAFKSEDMQQTGIPLLKIGNIQNNNVLKETDAYFPQSLYADKLDKYVLKNDDILIAMTGAGSVGKFGKMRNIERMYLVNQRVGIIRSKSGKITPSFLFYLLTLKHYEEFLYNIGTGAGQPNISPKDICDLKIKIPTNPVQQRIADILSFYDELVENNNRRIELLEKAAQDLYKEWFVRFRFPGYKTARFEKGIPVGWKVEKLGIIVQFRRGKTITAAETKAGEIPVVAGGLKPSCFHNASNTIAPVITVSASGANAGYSRLYYDNVWASDCSYLDTKLTNAIYYYYELIKNKQNIITNMQVGSAQPHVYPKDLNRLVIIQPDDNIVKLANEQFQSFHSEIKCLFGKNKNLVKQRDLLLPRLVSGKLEV